MKNKWIAFVAARYVSRGRRISSSSAFSILGIAVGVLALTVIISVMNGFQLGFIESILEVSSGHIRGENLFLEENNSGKSGEELIAEIRSLPQVRSVIPFKETNVLMRGRFAGIRGAVIRGVPDDIMELDPGFAEKLIIEEGFFDIEDHKNIVIGAELAKNLGVRTGGRISMLSVVGGTGEDDEDQYYNVSGIFRCGFYEYDLGWAFINIDRAETINAIGQNTLLEIKLKNRWQDRQAIQILENLVKENSHIKFISWRDYNRAFFGALRTEKLMMFILVGLIFVVVGLNIFQSQRRIVLERQEEIGLLKALGAQDRAVRLVFVLDGFIMGIMGAGIGLILGLLLAYNIPAFFSVLEKIAGFFITIANAFFYLLGSSGETEEFKIFPTQIFYIREIPSRVIPEEILMIFLFGFLSALAAAWIASKKAAGTKPAEVLRYE